CLRLIGKHDRIRTAPKRLAPENNRQLPRHFHYSYLEAIFDKTRVIIITRGDKTVFDKVSGI
ncbi:MAG: hypothetical protein QM734_07235, partial [Cyclobacteriaceae bacterium]